MKIRIKSNSLRIRLSKSEVDLFAERGWVEEQTKFQNDSFSYAVKMADIDTISADFINGSITLYIPEHLAKNWTSTSLVGLDYTMPVGNDSHLYILLEKDFKCIDAAIQEDQSDYFENPAKFC